MAKGSGGGGGPVGGGRVPSKPGTIAAYEKTYANYNLARLGTMRTNLAARIHATSSGPQRDKLERRLLAVERLLAKKAANPFGSASRSQIRRMSLYD